VSHPPRQHPSLLAAAHTSTGLVRTRNEDAFSISDELRLCIVCDGMGGHQDGDVASRLAVATALERLAADGPPPADDTPAVARLVAALHEVNDAVHLAPRRTSSHPMGTTIVVAWFLEHSVAIAHVGDSRCYRLRNGALELLTTDHSLVEEARRCGTVRGGAVDDELASRYQHVLTRALGVLPTCEVDARMEELAPGDRFLLCTDGVSGQVTTTAIGDALGGGMTPHDAARALVAAANRAGGRDNATAVVAWIVENPS
jgi:serine/threonine protein phosphatase PrpC